MSNNSDASRNVAKLGDFMCFAIYSTNLAYSRVYKPVLEKLGLTYPQYVAIICLVPGRRRMNRAEARPLTNGRTRSRPPIWKRICPVGMS